MGLLRLHRTAGRHSNPKPPQHVHSEIKILRKREQNALLGEVSRVYALATPLCAPIDEKIGHGAEQVSGVVRNDAVLGERAAGVLRLLREFECEITARVNAPADFDEFDGVREVRGVARFCFEQPPRAAASGSTGWPRPTWRWRCRT